MGYSVDCVEFSQSAVKKIKRFSKENNVKLNIFCSDIETFEYTKLYDIILCNGVLHYIDNKNFVIDQMKKHTKIGGINCISLFSSYSPLPECHKIVSVFPDRENGIVENSYRGWESIFNKYERKKKETSHLEMEEHIHSFIKLIYRRLK